MATYWGKDALTALSESIKTSTSSHLPLTANLNSWVSYEKDVLSSLLGCYYALLKQHFHHPLPNTELEGMLCNVQALPAQSYLLWLTWEHLLPWCCKAASASCERCSAGEAGRKETVFPPAGPVDQEPLDDPGKMVGEAGGQGWVRSWKGVGLGSSSTLLGSEKPKGNMSWQTLGESQRLEWRKWENSPATRALWALRLPARDMTRGTAVLCCLFQTCICVNKVRLTIIFRVETRTSWSYTRRGRTLIRVKTQATQSYTAAEQAGIQRSTGGFLWVRGYFPLFLG